MDANRLKPNKEFEAVAIRFLKETRLLGYWMEYVKKSPEFRYVHWSNRYPIDCIFGATRFTSFIASKKTGNMWAFYYCIYDLFAYWLKINNYDFTLSSCIEQKLRKKSFRDKISERFIVDEKTKKVTLNNFFKPKNC